MSCCGNHETGQKAEERGKNKQGKSRFLGVLAAIAIIVLAVLAVNSVLAHETNEEVSEDMMEGCAEMMGGDMMGNMNEMHGNDAGNMMNGMSGISEKEHLSHHSQG